MVRPTGGPQLPAGRAALLETPGDRARSMPLHDVSGCRFGESLLGAERLYEAEREEHALERGVHAAALVEALPLVEVLYGHGRQQPVVVHEGHAVGAHVEAHVVGPGVVLVQDGIGGQLGEHGARLRSRYARRVWSRPTRPSSEQNAFVTKIDAVG